MKAFEGMKKFFAETKSLKMCVCTYHHENDDETIYEYLSDQGLNCELSNSYIVFVDENEVPGFRKALIRAQK